jgi:hypothetical protein
MSELQFHPLADLFPLMEGEDFDALVADIAANGLREKIDLYQGKIVEGRNRYRALQRLGINPSADQKQYFRKAIDAHTVGGEIAPHEQSNDDRVRAYVISKNIHRRHLTPEQRRDLLVKLVAAQPEKADRVLAREAKVDHKQISRARRKAEATGAIAPVEKRTGADGKARKQPGPAKKLATALADPRARAVMREINDNVKAGDEALLEAVTRVTKAVQKYQSPEAMRVLAEFVSEHCAKGNLVDHALRLVEQMDAGERAKFFGLYLERYGDQKYVGKFTEAGREEESKAVAPPKRVRGRPPGSKNKPKAPTPVADTAAPQRGEDNVPSPEVGAEIMKAKLAALDDGIPGFLRREPKAAAS